MSEEKIDIWNKKKEKSTETKLDEKNNQENTKPKSSQTVKALEKLKYNKEVNYKLMSKKFMVFMNLQIITLTLICGLQLMLKILSLV